MSLAMKLPPAFHFLSLIVALFALTSQAADQNGFSVNAAIFYANSESDLTKIGGSKSENSQTYYDLSLGYTWASGLYLGGIYGSHQDDSGNNEISENYLGASLGYHMSGWEFNAHYFLSAENETSSTTSLTDGSGIGVDLAYLWNINSNFRVGPQLGYRSFNYTKYKSSGSKTEADTSISYTLPFIVFGLVF